MGAWYGSKATSGLCQPLIAAMPPHATYIETHLGGGAIMQRKPPALRNIGIDRNVRSIRTFRCAYEVELVHGCCHPLPGRVPVCGRRTGLRRPALSAAHPQIAAPLPL